MEKDTQENPETPTQTPKRKYSAIFRIGFASVMVILAAGIKIQLAIQASKLEAKAALEQVNGATADFLAISRAAQSANLLASIMLACCAIWLVKTILTKKR